MKKHWYIKGNLKNAEKEEGETESKPFQPHQKKKKILSESTWAGRPSKMV